MPSEITLRERFIGRNGLDWVDRSYGIDWCGLRLSPNATNQFCVTSRLVVLCIWMFTWVLYHTPVFERDFDLNDPLINHPIRHEQYV